MRSTKRKEKMNATAARTQPHKVSPQAQEDDEYQPSGDEEGELLYTITYLQYAAFSSSCHPEFILTEDELADEQDYAMSDVHLLLPLKVRCLS